MTPKVRDLIRDAAEQTKPTCGSGACGYGKWGCCDAAFCWAVHRGTRAQGFVYEFDPDAELPYMGPEGCRVPPEHRPGCAIFVCHTMRGGCWGFWLDEVWEEAAQDPGVKAMDTHFVGVVVQKLYVGPPGGGGRRLALASDVQDLKE